MKKILFFALLLMIMPRAEAANLTGHEIIEKSFDREDGTDTYIHSEMLLIDKNNDTRARLLDMYTKDYDNLRKGYIEFLEPPDIEGTAFLSWENEGDKDDTQYLYLPALGRPRRIVSSQKDLRFVNTDFTYEDMQRRFPDEDHHTLLDDEKFENFDCYVIQSIPKEANSQYGRRIHWVDKESLIIVRTLFFNKKDKLIKEFCAGQVELIDGYWTALTTSMTDHKENHKTVLKALEVKYDQGLEDDLFTTRQFRDRR